MYAVDFGIDTDSSYPYIARVHALILLSPSCHTIKGYFILLCVQQNLCLYTSENVGVLSTGMVQIEYGAEDHLQMAIALVGPVTVSIDSRHSTFQVSEGFKMITNSYNDYV